MKKFVKVIVSILIIIVLVIAVDTMQAKLLNNSPIIKKSTVIDGVNVDRGILVDTYILNDSEKVSVFKWEDYNVFDTTADNTYTNDELKEMALDYFLNNTEYALSKEDYNVGVSEEVPEIYEGQNLVVIEIRHINNGNNTLDARYYVNKDTAKGFDDMENSIDLNN